MRMRIFVPVVMLLTILACSPFSGAEIETVAAPTAVSNPTQPSATLASEPTATLVADTESSPFISDELCQQFDRSRDGEPGVRGGDDLHRITLEGEGVVCNDGTPAVMYVKRATNPANDGVWVFHFQGGGACNTYEQCATRWCGVENYDAGKMSSRWSPLSMQGSGLFAVQEQNPWHDVNQVFVYYCSSDGWTGQANDVVFADPDEPTNRFSMHTQGHTIIAAVIDTLWSGSASDNGVVSMPNLADASEVIFTGTSAGAGGVTHNLDWLATKFDTELTRVVGVIDAGSRPLPEMLEPALGAEVEAFLVGRTGFVNDANSFLDQSCVALTAPDEQWKCSNGPYVQLNHITTPFFVRMDLGDSLMIRTFVALGGDRLEIAASTRAHMLQFATINHDAVEAEVIDFVPGVYAPGCGQHVGLTSGAWYSQATVLDQNGVALTLNAAIQPWYSGQQVLAVDTVPPTNSECRQTNDARD